MARAKFGMPHDDISAEQKQEIAMLLSDRIYNDALTVSQYTTCRCCFNECSR